ASLFVQSSLTEGVSLTILEAMARGLPVVATRVGGNPEVMVDGVTGLLVPSAAPEKLTEAILRLLGSPEQRRRFGEAGRRRVEEVFDVRRMVREYEALYEDGMKRPATCSHALRGIKGYADATNALYRRILLPAHETLLKGRRTFRHWQDLERSQWL